MNQARTDGPAIAVTGLSRRFGEVRAVDDISFEVAQGEVFSLLGPNGAGKSTTIAMLCGLLQPDVGDVSVMGHSIRTEPMAAKRALGVVPQDIALYEDMSADENLRFWGALYGLGGAELDRRVAEMLSLIGLADRKRGRFGTFSGGMKRRVNIAAALLHRPRVVVLDEPTVGIDPQSRRHILDHVLDLNRQGTTVLYTTHYMEEAEELSDRVAIMDHGKVIACGTQEELVRLVGGQTRVELAVSAGPEAAADAWRGLEGIRQATAGEGSVVLLVADANAVVPRLFEAVPAGTRITSVDIREPNLESVFLSLTGRALRD